MQKPKCVAAYNKYMGGVDVSNRKIYHVSAERPSKRYWKKIFFDLLDMALLNSYELYQSNTDAGQHKTRHDFLASVVESLCAVAGPPPELPGVHHDLKHIPGSKERDCRLFRSCEGCQRGKKDHLGLAGKLCCI